MNTQNAQIAPIALPAARHLARKPLSPGSLARIDVWAGAMFALFLVPVFLYLEVSLAIAVPLSVLLGLTSQHLFRLMFSPDRNDVFFPTTLVVGYFVIDFAARSFCLATVPLFARMGRNPYDDYIPAALWCACAGYLSFSAGIGSNIARRWLRRMPADSFSDDDWTREFNLSF